MWKSATFRPRDFKGEASLERNALLPAANFEDDVAGLTSEYMLLCWSQSLVVEMSNARQEPKRSRRDGARLGPCDAPEGVDKLSERTLLHATRVLVF